MQERLFEESAGEAKGLGQRRAGEDPAAQSAPPRLVTADRSQVELRPFDLDGLIPADHRARLIWQAVERLDLSRFYEWIRAREHQPGRPPTDPKVFVALWVYATAEGVASARELERLCEEHRAYQKEAKRDVGAQGAKLEAGKEQRGTLGRKGRNLNRWAIRPIRPNEPVKKIGFPADLAGL
jgi:hypothetical protein